MMYKLCLILFFVSVSQGLNVFDGTVRCESFKTTQEGCNETGMNPDTRFYLFTINNCDQPELLHKCGGCLPQNSKFNPSCKTEIFLPGYMSGISNFAIYRELKNERLKSGCYNVILVDWSWGNMPDLTSAKENIPIVANQVCEVIKCLKTRGLKNEDIILTGHSFGAHMANYVTKCEPVSIINGLDPAGVMEGFEEKANNSGKLDASDAPCVYVGHTGEGQCLPQSFGINYTAGTADFWFNGGKNQPGQWDLIAEAIKKEDLIYALFNLWPAPFNHFRILHYYLASMNPGSCQFTGVECDVSNIKRQNCNSACKTDGSNCKVAGAYTCNCADPAKTPINYHVKTTAKCDYCDPIYPLNRAVVTCGIGAPEPKNRTCVVQI